jgi:hypothetical protein
MPTWTVLNKSLEWGVLVAVMTAYLILRAKQLHWAERATTGLFGAGLAFAFTDDVAAWEIVGGSETIAAVLIMLFLPAILNSALVIGEDKEFVVKTLKAWARNWLGVKDDDSSN